MYNLWRELAHDAADLGFTLEPGEADRLELSMDVFERVFRGMECSVWQGLGFAVQTYQKRAWPVLHWLREQAQA